MYFQRLKSTQKEKNPWPGKPGQFFEPDWWMKKNWERPHKADLSYLTYADSIDIFAEIFGRDALGIFLFEDLVEDQAQFIRNLCSFIGINEDEGANLCGNKRSNPQLTEAQIERIKTISASRFKSLAFRLLPQKIRSEKAWLNEPPEKSPKAPFSLSEDWRKRIEEFTREGNRKLVAEWGLPLQKFNYPL
jgi:hypothetical protein